MVVAVHVQAIVAREARVEEVQVIELHWESRQQNDNVREHAWV